MKKYLLAAVLALVAITPMSAHDVILQRMENTWYSEGWDAHCDTPLAGGSGEVVENAHSMRLWYRKAGNGIDSYGALMIVQVSHDYRQNYDQFVYPDIGVGVGGFDAVWCVSYVDHATTHAVVEITGYNRTSGHSEVYKLIWGEPEDGANLVQP